MKKLLKKTLAFFAASLMMLSFSTNAFATNKHFTRSYGAYYQYSVNLKNLSGQESITVVNTGNVPLDIHIGGVFRGRLLKNQQVTAWYRLGGTKSVKVDPSQTNYTHSFRIMTSSHSDTITKVR